MAETKDFDCPNCGAPLSQGDKNCKYCGSANPHYNAAKSSLNNIFNTDSNNATNNNFNIVLFIVLLILFWPAAIIYLIYASTKK